MSPLRRPRRVSGRTGGSALGLIYLIIGVLVAINYGYGAAGFDGLSNFLSLLLAVVFWPLLLLGVTFAVHL